MDKRTRKMIFPHKINQKRTCHSAKGFTLLEVVIVLAISAVIIGGGITALVINSSERILRNASADIELLAKKAHTAAALHQTPYVIEFHPHSLNIRPAAKDNISNSVFAEPATNQNLLTEKLAIHPAIAISIRHWNRETFITTTKKNVPVWQFNPNGLSEPITVKLVLADSYAQDTYHPLTATIVESELEAN